MDLDISLATVCIRTPHPQLDMIAMRWRSLLTDEVPTDSTNSILGRQTIKRPDGVQDIYMLRHGHTDEMTWRKSPFYKVLRSGRPLHIRLSPPPSLVKFPIVHDLIKRGMTDYLTMPFLSRREVSMAISLATSREGGFPNAFANAFHAAIPVLSLAMAYKVERFQFEQVLAAYLGREPASLVLKGQVRRGDIVATVAAVGFVDLRGFTDASERLTSNALLARLSTFFEYVHTTVVHAGGEIIKFMGDGVLFIIPDKGNPQLTCTRALEVVGGLTNAVSAHNASTSEAPLHFGVGMHFGEMLYGNIGSPTRLDFTVLGPVVNLTSRLESLTGQLGEVCIVSETFAKLTGSPHRLVGEFKLKGIKGMSQVFAPLLDPEDIEDDA